MPKIALFALNSSYSHTNSAVRCIKKSLFEAGFEAEILEYNLKDKRRNIIEALIRVDADIYGFSVYIWNIAEMCLFASDLKKLVPGAKIVFGGPEVSFECEAFLKAHPYVDTIIRGEGESAFVSFVNAYLSQKHLPSIIDGSVFEGFEKQGMVYSNNELYNGKKIVYYESSRGCPYRCAYCLSSLSGKVRAKDANTALSELLMFEEMDNIKVIKLVDRTFNFDMQRAKTILRGLLSEKYTKNYHFEICAELLDDEIFDIFSKFPSGKIQLEIGVQSSNSNTLKIINRSTNVEVVINNIKRLYELGNIHIHADLIAGLPLETMDTFKAAFDCLYNNCHMLQLGFLKLLKGSVLRENAEKYGLVYSDRPPYEVLYTDSMSFSELDFLHIIDEIMSRYKSRAFKLSMKLLEGRFESAFDMFSNLAEGFIKNGSSINELSQPDAYRKLYEIFAIGKDDELCEALSLDFLTYQKLSLPKFSEFELKRAEDFYKRDFIEFAKEHNIDFYVPSIEARQGSFIYVVDRKNMKAYKYTDGNYVVL